MASWMRTTKCSEEKIPPGTLGISWGKSAENVGYMSGKWGNAGRFWGKKLLKT